MLYSREGRTSHTTISAFLLDPWESPFLSPSPWLQCLLLPGSLSWGHRPHPVTTILAVAPGDGHTNPWRGTQDTLVWLPALWSLAAGRAEGSHSQQPQLVPESHSQPLLQLRVHLGRCLLAQGPTEELEPGQTRRWQHNRVAGAARDSRSSLGFSWLGSQRRCEGAVLGTGNAPGLLAGRLPLSALKPSHLSTYTPLPPALRPCSNLSEPSLALQRPPCTVRPLSPSACSSSHCSDSPGMAQIP